MQVVPARRPSAAGARGLPEAGPMERFRISVWMPGRTAKAAVRVPAGSGSRRGRPPSRRRGLRHRRSSHGTARSGSGPIASRGACAPPVLLFSPPAPAKAKALCDAGRVEDDLLGLGARARPSRRGSGCRGRGHRRSPARARSRRRTRRRGCSGRRGEGGHHEGDHEAMTTRASPGCPRSSRSPAEGRRR
jgi:hypothetical protein